MDLVQMLDLAEDLAPLIGACTFPVPEERPTMEIVERQVSALVPRAPANSASYHSPRRYNTKKTGLGKIVQSNFVKYIDVSESSSSSSSNCSYGSYSGDKYESATSTPQMAMSCQDLATPPNSQLKVAPAPAPAPAAQKKTPKPSKTDNSDRLLRRKPGDDLKLWQSWQRRNSEKAQSRRASRPKGARSVLVIDPDMVDLYDEKLHVRELQGEVKSYNEDGYAADVSDGVFCGHTEEIGEGSQQEIGEGSQQEIEQGVQEEIEEVIEECETEKEEEEEEGGEELHF